MKMLFLGDFLYNHVEINEDILELGKYFRNQNLTVVLNCEGSLKAEKPLDKNSVFAHNERIVEILIQLNARAVSLGNNHSMDWREQGLARLISALDNRAIKHYGAGMNLAEASAPAILEDENQRRIGLLGFGWDVEMCVYAGKNEAGVAPLQEDFILEEISRVRKEVDILVVTPHWGYEFEVYPLPIHRKLAFAMIDAGADAIIGHHPHIIQAFEKYHDKPIYYSIGNFYVGTKRVIYFRRTFKQKNVNPNIGLGVLLDTDSLKIQHSVFGFNGNQTRIIETDFPLEELLQFDSSMYNKIFSKMRTSHIKPALYDGRWQAFLNWIKLKLFTVKLTIIRFIMQVFIQIKIYEIIKDIPFLRRFSHVLRGSEKMYVIKNDRDERVE